MTLLNLVITHPRSSSMPCIQFFLEWTQNIPGSLFPGRLEPTMFEQIGCSRMPGNLLTLSMAKKITFCCQWDFPWLLFVEITWLLSQNFYLDLSGFLITLTLSESSLHGLSDFIWDKSNLISTKIINGKSHWEHILSAKMNSFFMKRLSKRHLSRYCIYIWL